MGARTKWTLRVERLRTKLALDAAPETVEVSLVIQGLFEARPRVPADALDLAAVCAWITGPWSRSPPTPMLEMRINELLDHVFRFDARVQEVSAAVFRAPARAGSSAIGVERQANRAQFNAQARLARG